MINSPNIIFLLILFLSLTSYSLSIKFPMKKIEYKQINNISNKLRNLNSSNFHSYDEFYNIMSIPLCLGIPKQCFNLVYDTGEMYLIVSNPAKTAMFTKFYNITSSQTSISNTYYYTALQYRNGIMQLREVGDYVFFSDNKPSYLFNFLLTWNTTKSYNFEGILGLGYLYPERDESESFDARFSFIDYLKYNKLINKKLFGHEYYNRTHGSFYIDEIPYTMSDNYFKCKVEGFIPYLNKWHCKMRSLAFSTGENFTEIHSSVAFSTGYTDIRGPYVEGLIIFDSLMPYFDNKCEIIDNYNDDYTYSKIICNNSLSFINIPDILFNIQGFQLILLKDDLFRLVEYNGEKKYICKIIIDTRYTYWNLGEPILKNYNMVFDYDDKSVGFRENVNLTGESWFMIFVLISILISVCSIGIWIYSNRRRLFMKNIKEEDFEKLKGNEAFDEGKEMDSNYE